MSPLKRIKKAVFTCGEAAFSGISQTLDEKVVLDQLFKPLLCRQEISVKKKKNEKWLYDKDACNRCGLSSG